MKKRSETVEIKEGKSEAEKNTQKVKNEQRKLHEAVVLPMDQVKR